MSTYVAVKLSNIPPKRQYEPIRRGDRVLVIATKVQYLHPNRRFEGEVIDVGVRWGYSSWYKVRDDNGIVHEIKHRRDLEKVSVVRRLQKQ